MIDLSVPWYSRHNARNNDPPGFSTQTKTSIQSTSPVEETLSFLTQIVISIMIMFMVSINVMAIVLVMTIMLIFVASVRGYTYPNEGRPN